jgi:hypothetical protein
MPNDLLDGNQALRRDFAIVMQPRVVGAALFKIDFGAGGIAVFDRQL